MDVLIIQKREGSTYAANIHLILGLLFSPIVNFAIKLPVLPYVTACSLICTELIIFCTSGRYLLN